EAIKSLQNQAKNYQYEINEVKSKIEKSEIKLEKIKPNYQLLEKDYQKLLKAIEDEEKSLNNLKTELKEMVNEKNQNFKNEFDIKEIDTLKTKKEIDFEIKEIDREINKISSDKTNLDNKNLKDLSNIIAKLDNFNNSIMEQSDDMLFKYDKDEIVEIIENFRKVEDIKNQLQIIINKFLVEINIEVSLHINFSDDYKNAFIKTDFLHSIKNHLNFEDLTTPEKIFFIISFYISLKVVFNCKNIIFSNLFIPSQYNKRGSVYRTISKILPIFKTDQNIQDFNLVFIISNLEMKKKIDELNVIKIEEN
ncbi:MAG: coiled-coil domain-containing protein, partial [Candidatus Hermodarchaeota archaeon]